ncbi:hypothetical protein [Breoghania sp.]|uniref:hypothetical protein n=1 Tax=Breoghania sp. TaxID=2065378 RepID=UPI0029C9F65A|nr:hypothetical protein [Breoghania sp.]
MKLSEAIQIWRAAVGQRIDDCVTLMPDAMREVSEALAGAFEMARRLEAEIDEQNAEIRKLKAQLDMQHRQILRVLPSGLGPNVTLFPIIARPVPVAPEGGAA